jgi:DNA-binding MarR family transcriptional regulator
MGEPSEPSPVAVTATTSATRLANLTTRSLSMAANHADRIVTERLAGVGARKWHYAVLATLEEFGPASQAQLSDRTRIHRSDVVAVINELADDALVERAPDPGDGRRNVITITAKGRRRLRRLDSLLVDAQDELLAPLDARERRQLHALLAKLVDHHASAGWARM